MCQALFLYYTLHHVCQALWEQIERLWDVDNEQPCCLVLIPLFDAFICYMCEFSIIFL